MNILEKCIIIFIIFGIGMISGIVVEKNHAGQEKKPLLVCQVQTNCEVWNKK